jgi:hypothetical protein
LAASLVVVLAVRAGFEACVAVEKQRWDTGVACFSGASRASSASLIAGSALASAAVGAIGACADTAVLAVQEEGVLACGADSAG